jgi:hypothetical protein
MDFHCTDSFHGMDYDWEEEGGGGGGGRGESVTSGKNYIAKCRQ